MYYEHEERERKRERERREGVSVNRGCMCGRRCMRECVYVCCEREKRGERVCEVCVYITLGFNALHMHIIHVHVSLTDTIIQLTLYQLMYMYVLD